MTKRRITDKDYFYDRFKAKGLSLRRVAAILNTEHANLSKILSGSPGRYASIDLVCDLARLFGVPVEDVARRLGYDVPHESTAKVHVVGEAAASGKVEELTKRAGGTVERPRGAPDDMVAIRMHDGALAYFVPGVSIDPSAVGRLAVVRDAERQYYVGKLVLGKRPRTWNVGDFEGLTVKMAAPVEWIKL